MYTHTHSDFVDFGREAKHGGSTRIACTKATTETNVESSCESWLGKLRGRGLPHDYAVAPGPGAGRPAGQEAVQAGAETHQACAEASFR
jgi:hypothetical protein